MIRYLKRIIGSLLIGFLAGEIFILIIGYRVFHPKIIHLEHHPTEVTEIDDLLGYTSVVGTQQTIKNNQLYSTATHWKDHSRATRVNMDTGINKERIHLYGCSITYGQHLDDSSTMGWQIQNQLPQYDIRNYAFIGYGLHQTYLQLRHQISLQNIPDLVIVNYASFHDERNVLSRNRQKQLVPYVRQKDLLEKISWPILHLSTEKELNLSYEKLSYQEWPGMRYSALIHFIEHVYNQLLRDKKIEQEISYTILEEIQKWSKQYGFRFLVTGIFDDDKTRSILKRCNRKGMNTLDIAVDLQNSTYNLMPYDGHPNALANKIYSQKVFDFLLQKGWITTPAKAIFTKASQNRMD